MAHDHLSSATQPILISAALFAGGWLALKFSTQHAQRYAGLTVAGLAAFMTADLAIGNGPNRSTAMPPSDMKNCAPIRKTKRSPSSRRIFDGRRIPSGGNRSNWWASASNGRISA